MIFTILNGKQDNYLEAKAGKQAGVTCFIADRPGNNPLPGENTFTVIKSFQELFQNPSIQFKS